MGVTKQPRILHICWEIQTLFGSAGEAVSRRIDIAAIPRTYSMVSEQDRKLAVPRLTAALVEGCEGVPGIFHRSPNCELCFKVPCNAKQFSQEYVTFDSAESLARALTTTQPSFTNNTCPYEGAHDSQPISSRLQPPCCVNSPCRNTRPQAPVCFPGFVGARA